MALKRYLSTLVFPTSPRRSRTASSESPVSARSPIEDLRDFWKATFEESLKQGERYREDALARMRAQRGLLSDAEVWDLQTMNDGLVVERDDLSDFAQSPERLSFEVVSRASRYKSRAQSLYSEVREVVRRSRASIESAQMRASEYRHAEQRGAVTRHADVSDSLPCGSSAIHSRSQQRAEGHYAGAELCGSPPACNSSSSSSSYSRFPLASSDRHAALIGSVSKPHGSSWETTVDDENYGIRQVSSGPGTNETILPRSEKQGVDIGQWAADIGKHMGGVAQRRGAYERRSTQSDLSELSEFSPGPPTPHSSPQSSPPSADLSTSPAFLKKLDDALKGLNVSLTGLDVGSVEDHSQVFVDTSFTMHRTSPTHLLSRGKTHMLRGPRDPIRATQSQLNPVLPLPFRPVPDLRRAASQPQLQSRAPRERLPVLFTREDIEALRVMTSDLASSTSPPTDDDEDIEDEEDLFKDDCTVETASVVVQPYGHSRANTTDRPIICSPEGFPLRTPPLNWFEGVKY